MVAVCYKKIKRENKPYLYLVLQKSGIQYQRGILTINLKTIRKQKINKLNMVNISVLAHVFAFALNVL